VISWRVSAGGFTAAAVAVVLIVLSGSSGRPGSPAEANALPIFDRPAVDATRIRSATPTLAAEGAQYTQARTFTISGATGYVMRASDGRICLAVPDNGVESFGEACAPEAEVNQRGLHVVLAAGDGARFAAVVPSTATDASLETVDGQRRPLTISAGLISGAASGAQSVVYSVAGREVSFSVRSSMSCIHLDNVPATEKQDILKRLGVPECPADGKADK
jgi:hypothetical protein